MSPPLDLEDGPSSPRVGDYRKESIVAMVKARGGWLTVFFVGLVLAAIVVERFEDLLTNEVELSYFVPLLIGHGGNTGSQSVATVIRALALKQITPRDMLVVLLKEGIAGVVMGAFLGILVWALTSCQPTCAPAVVSCLIAITLLLARRSTLSLCTIRFIRKTLPSRHPVTTSSRLK